MSSRSSAHPPRQRPINATSLSVSALRHMQGFLQIRAWSSAEDHAFFMQQAEACDAVVMGRRSYNSEVKCDRIYLLTHDLSVSIHSARVQILSGDIRDIYARIESDGNHRVALLGGPATNHAFLKENLVDEIFLTIEPVLLGTGLRLSAGELDSRWILAELIPLNQAGTVVMHYRRIGGIPVSILEKKEKRWRAILRHPLFLKILNQLEQKERDRVFCKHDLPHFLDTARILYTMVLEGGYPYSMDLAYGAGLLHDIGRYIEYTGGSPHEIAAEPVVREILGQCSYTEVEIDEIARAISAHGDKDASSFGSLGELLYRADKTGRPCFRCPAAEDCYWPEERKQNSLSY